MNLHNNEVGRKVILQTQNNLQRPSFFPALMYTQCTVDVAYCYRCSAVCLCLLGCALKSWHKSA